MLTQSLRVVPALLSAVTQFAAASSLGSGGAAASVDTCGAGGTRSLSCVVDAVHREYTLTFQDCRLANASGSILINGTITANSNVVAPCDSLPTFFDSFAMTDLQVLARDGQDQRIFDASLTIGGQGSFTASLGSCLVASVDAQLTGTAIVELNTLTLTLMSNGANFGVAVDQYSNDCVIEKSAVSLVGAFSVSSSLGGDLLASSDGLFFNSETTADGDLVDLSGNLTSECFGMTLGLETATPIFLPKSAACPIQGKEKVSYSGVVDSYDFVLNELTQAGGVNADAGDNGSIDAVVDSCLSPALYLCLG